MDHVEAAFVVFAHQGQFRERERLGHARHQGCVQDIADRWQVWLGQAARKRDVEVEILHHVGVAPLDKVGILPRAELCCAAFGKLCFGCRGTVGVERFDAARGQVIQLRCVPDRAQGEEPAQLGQIQPVKLHRGQGRAQIPYGLFKVRLGVSGLQPERRLDCRVQPVFARGCGDVSYRQRALRVRHRAAREHVPAQPAGGKLRPVRVLRRDIIQSETVKGHAGTARVGFIKEAFFR